MQWRSNGDDFMKSETIGNCILYLGDCLEIIPTLDNIDVIITDPVWPNCPADLIPGSDNPHQLFKDFCNCLSEDLRQLVVVMRNDSDPRFLQCVPEFLNFQQIAWLQYVMPSYLGRVLGGNECAYVFGTPRKSKPGCRVIPSISPKAQPSDRPRNGHPCSRALIHQKWLVKWFAEEHEVVVDPFMGSGTVGVACAKMGRKFIGIEIKEEYFDIACRQIEEAYDQADMFIEPPPQKKQEKLI